MMFCCSITHRLYYEFPFKEGTGGVLVIRPIALYKNMDENYSFTLPMLTVTKYF